MPLGILGAAAISSGANVAGGLINAGSTARQNAESQQFSERMYQRQFQDNLTFWRMQNEYNSPAQQMARFKEAGLNPNLIYGQGNSGNASSISTPDVQSPQFRTPEWGNALSTGGLAFVNAIYDLDIKQAQIDNLRVQNSVIQQDALLKAAQTRSTGIYGDKAKFGLDFESELKDVSAESRREQLRQLRTTTDLSINKDAREAAANASTIKEAAERMLNLRAERGRIGADTDRIRETINQLEKDGVLKDLEIELRKMGINPNDPTWMRVVGRFVTNLFEENGEFKNTSGNIWKMLFGK